MCQSAPYPAAKEKRMDHGAGIKRNELARARQSSGRGCWRVRYHLPSAPLYTGSIRKVDVREISTVARGSYRT